MENMSKNLADNDEYPAMLHLHQRCVSMLGNLWGVTKGEQAMGTATTGSSEAILLGGLAMKRRWFERQQAKGNFFRCHFSQVGKDTSKPNILMGANAQVALEFGFSAGILLIVENLQGTLKSTPELSLSARSPIIVLTLKKFVKILTRILSVYLIYSILMIGIFVILGSTYTGHYEPVEEVAKLLDEYEKETGIDIPIHVDGASGALFCPFATPSVKFGFQIPRVKSINAYITL